MSGVNNLRHWRYLHDIPELEPLIAQWFLQEWPSHYGCSGNGDVWQDIANVQRLVWGSSPLKTVNPVVLLR